MSLRILGICGSPRKGATAYSLKVALEYAETLGDVESEYIGVRGKKIGFCLHCDYCLRTKKGCVQEDDVAKMYPAIEGADALILATPVYQGSVSAQLKAVMDRCRAVVARDPDALSNKAGAAIAVGGDRSGGQEPAIATIHAFYLANKMIPVSGGPFGANMGGTIWSRDKGARGAEDDSVGVESIRATVRRLVEVACMLQGEGG
jgi:multimeric flavodoxin WrbA